MQVKGDEIACAKGSDRCPTTAPLSRTVLVVLTTGLPASGKSTFIQNVTAFLDERNSGVTVEEKDVADLSLHTSIAKVRSLRLDDYLLQLYETQQSTSFHPSVWHKASKLLYTETEAILTRALLNESATEIEGTSGEGLRIDLLLFIEDNMYYKSMRERYWKLCRRLNSTHFFSPSERNNVKGEHVSGPFISLLELQFHAPLPICLQRNAQREVEGVPSATGVIGTKDSVIKVRVPPHVVNSMHELFESGIDSSTEKEEEDEDKEATCIFRRRATTLPWCLVTVSLDCLEQYPDAAEGVRFLFGCQADRTSNASSAHSIYLTSLLYQILQEQFVAGWRAHLVHTRDLLLQQEGDTCRQINATNLAHILDERMRVHVKHFFLERCQKKESETTGEQKRLRQQVQVLKKEYQAQFRVAVKRAPKNIDDFELIEATLSSFCEELLKLS